MSSSTLILQVCVALDTGSLAMVCMRLWLRDGIRKHHLSTSPLARWRSPWMIFLSFYSSHQGRLLDHFRIKRDETHEMIVIYLGADPMDAMMQCESIRGAHAKFSYLEMLYQNNLELAGNADSDDLQVTCHRECVLRCFLIFLIGTSIFVDKSVTYFDEAYLKYFINLSAIHEWNLEAACLAYLYSTLSEGSLWTTKQMTGFCTPLTVISISTINIKTTFFYTCY